MNSIPTQGPIHPTQPSQGRGCFFYGCLTAIIVSLIAVAATIYGVKVLKEKVVALVGEYSEATPASLPKLSLSAEQAKAMSDNVAAFLDEKGELRPGAELKLTSDDLNAWVQNDPAWKEAREHIYFSIVGDELRGEISLPLKEFGFDGRYLNGAAAFNIELKNGSLNLTVRDLKVKGQPLPEEFMSRVRDQNLASELYKDKEKMERIKQFERIEIKDGVLTLITKR